MSRWLPLEGRFVSLSVWCGPWRLWLGLRRGVIAALAFSILLLINPTVWQLGISSSCYRLMIISVCVVAVMAMWLMFYHHLWMPRGDPSNRRQTQLFNAFTVITLVLGLSVAFIAFLVVNYVMPHMMLSDTVLAKSLGYPPRVIDYVKLSWMATVGASVVGALGTGFETEEDVREAAYSQREADRRKQWRSGTDHAFEPSSGDEDTGR